MSTMETIRLPDNLVHCAADVIAAYLRHHQVAAKEIPALINSVHGTFAALAAGESIPLSTTSQKPAVPVKNSVKPDYIVCLEDGAKLKLLKRYLRARYGLSPQEYRAKWGLPANYPMTAPNYAARRSSLAKSNGLGKWPRGKTR